MYIEYSAGDKTDPWRTPVDGEKECEVWPSSRTEIETLLNKFCSNQRVVVSNKVVGVSI
jgi:hypothetical protein